MRRAVRLSLATKCQLLFGAAVVIILAVALSVVWLRMELLVDEAQQEIARQLADAWLYDRIQLGGYLTPAEELGTSAAMEGGVSLTLAELDELDLLTAQDPRLATLLARFRASGDRDEAFERLRDERGRRYYRYVRAIRKSDLVRYRAGPGTGYEPTIETSAFADPLQMVLVIQLRPELPARQLVLNRVYLVMAGLLSCLLAILVFWFITMRLILSPVRVLRATASKVAEGDLAIRAAVHTGDEFQQLGDVFNHMLESLKATQDQLRAANKSLDLKLGELAETNVNLYEANKVKGEFLANVSHELRTPLNSIVGFAQVLAETFEESTTSLDQKRLRYIHNIITSSKQLLELINDLLDLAKIEAGRMELHPGTMSVADTLEGLVNLIRPQAEARRIDLLLRIPANLPMIETDTTRFGQIIFNFLSNAVKFTPPEGRVTVAAAMTGSAESPTLAVSVSDTGPGIPEKDQERVFEKFTQLDPSVTREHGGTGLGLTICRELADLLQGRIDLVSQPGHGANFTLTIPKSLQPVSDALMPG